MTARIDETATSEAGRYADLNGLHMYYETHGTGRPLVLLHGGLEAGEMFGPILPALTAQHQVVVPDLQGHGRTADIDRPLDVRLMADDIAALIDHLRWTGPTWSATRSVAGSRSGRRPSIPTGSASWS